MQVPYRPNECLFKKLKISTKILSTRKLYAQMEFGEFYQIFKKEIPN